MMIDTSKIIDMENLTDSEREHIERTIAENLTIHSECSLCGELTQIYNGLCLRCHVYMKREIEKPIPMAIWQKLAEKKNDPIFTQKLKDRGLI